MTFNVAALAPAIAPEVWQAGNSSGAPSGRFSGVTVWTGTEMLIWGGYNGAARLGDGARYNPVTDTWASIASTGAPSARLWHTAIWTGTEMIVWGGDPSGDSGINTGARYNPLLNTWNPVSTAGAPSGRRSHSAVWTGSEMIIWGGDNGGINAGNPKNDGARYNPVTDTWTPIATTAAPSVRTFHSAVWIGTEMIIWGGYQYGNGLAEGQLGDGARYSLANDSWTPISDLSAPTARTMAAVVWSGSEMIVWGGVIPGPSATAGDGARYNPASNTWTPISSNGAPSRRGDYPMLSIPSVWTGSEMLIWGGRANGSGGLNDGARYNPLNNTWTAITTHGAPTARYANFAVWAGDRMIVWGGNADGFHDGTTSGALRSFT